MELMEIIKSSLSLFSMIMLGVVILSYVIYKFKDQDKPKPYERLVEEQKAAGLHKEELLLKQKAHEQKMMHEHYLREQMKIEQQKQYQAQLSSEPRNQNNYLNQDVQRREVMAERRFRVVNAPAAVVPVYAAPNIYELYSQNEKDQMHKLKLAAN